MKPARYYFITAGLLIFATGLSISCATQRQHHNSSVVDYLYPGKSDPIENAAIPVLSLPIKVGIAFVPGSEQSRTGFTTNFSAPMTPPLPEKEKIALMKEIGDNFKKYPFVKSIELIPSAYLRPGGSFTNLDQLRTMFGVDVIALLSYDQVQFTDEGMLSMSYWTLAGAYVVRGEKDDTNTMVDAAVYHIQSRKMLFRAPGISQIKGSATPVNLSEQLRTDSTASFHEAAKDLVVNLQEQLELFQEKVKTSPEEFKVVQRPGSTGGGGIDPFVLILVSGMGAYSLWQRKNHN
ncbi:MAG TPA: rhombotarget lipoprotein [Nitrospiria bacterium]|jgi:rhombotail lipoprotein|nr:rhombotarget lipoprotein [Nitrospiria bacterium]